jgi:hypothetical protein
LPFRKAPSRLVLLIHRDSLRRDTVGDHGPLGREAGYGLGAVDDDLPRIGGVEHVAAVRPDILAAVAHPALVPRALEYEPEPGTRFVAHLAGHRFEFVPGLRGTVVAALFQQILAVVQEARIRERRHGIGFAVEDYGVDRAWQELLLAAFGEAVRQVGHPAARGQLSGPDDVAEDHIEVLPAGLELGPELV